MKAVMYGGGNIGRGFIGALLSQSGYEVTFVDVVDAVVDTLNREHKYPVRILSNEGHKDVDVVNVSAVNGNNMDAVADAIANADIMATAVGARILKFIVPNIVAGLRKRWAMGKAPLNIIICENLMDANKVLEGMLKEQLTEEEKAIFDQNVGLVEASIGRMVPVQTEEMKDGNPMRVCVESYGFLPVDKAAFKGEIPQITNMVPFEPFDFYIKRKLYIQKQCDLRLDKTDVLIRYQPEFICMIIQTTKNQGDIMQFVELLKKKTADNPGTRTPVIAFLGDSVTQGVFETYEKDKKMQVVFDSTSAYSEKVKELLALLYPQAPISVMNAGVNGSSATSGYERLKRDVLAFSPDLLVVCFGLNDCNEELEGLETYKTALRNIFTTAKMAGIETIFMTPNMMNTHSGKVSPGDILEPLAEVFAKRQLEGVLDAYMDAARQVCKEESIMLCDCYAIWKRMHESGVDTTNLLSNGLNHPIRKMHELFAWQLVQTILDN